MKAENGNQAIARLAEAQGYHATFKEVVERARASGPVDQEFIDRVEKEFSAVETQIQEATEDVVLDNLRDRAEELERLRAYVLPDHEILLQARTCLADMRDWGVPRPILRTIERDLLSAMDKKDDVKIKRAALHKLFDFYDAWESQVTDYEQWIVVRARWLSALLGVSLIGTVVALVTGSGIGGFLAGGLAGSFVSVLSRLPSMLGWEKWAGLSARMYSRIGLGVAGTMAGGGLLASGLLSIGRSSGEFSQMVSLDHAATTAEGLYLVSLGILFGFSERWLSGLAGSLIKTPAAPRNAQLAAGKAEDA
jgi:hypothetical protein